MVRARASLISCAIACTAVGCAAHKDAWQDANDRDTQAYLAEEARFQELRREMRSVARSLSLELPIACDYAVNDVRDLETKSDLLALAATGGIYLSARCCALDPRVGLADVTVTFGTLLELFQHYAAQPEYKGLQPVVIALTPAVARFQELSKEWLPAETLAQVEHDIKEATTSQETRIRASSVASSAMASTAVAAPSLRIQSSFLSFNDNGLLEYGLSEAHQIRLSAQEMAACIALMPTALDYHSRRSALWLTQQPPVTGIQAKLEKVSADLDSLKKLESLGSLSSLETLARMPWLVTGGVVVGLALQGFFISRALRAIRESKG